jgi:hypothetical protein
LTNYPKEIDAITLGKDVSGWFRDEPSWPEVVGEVFLIGDNLFPSPPDSKDNSPSSEGRDTNDKNLFIPFHGGWGEPHAGCSSAKLVFQHELKADNGIVNLTRIWQTGQHEKANTQLPTSPVSL